MVEELLSLQMMRASPWSIPVARPVELFCDAAGSPGRLAAVVYTHDGRSLYTDMAPPAELMEFFKPRRDKQICGLELCAIALGLCTFADHCDGRCVRIWSDNAGSEHATRRGSAKAWDHTCVVHAIWVKAAMLRCRMWVERVPSALNIADLPSRKEYGLMAAMGTVWVPPVLDKMFWQQPSWYVFS